MKIELNENKVFFNNGSQKKEIHPFWLRERVDGEEFLDKGTQQRLFDPTSLNSDISINNASINNNFLEILDLINFSNALSEVVTGSYPLPFSLLDILKGLSNFL